MILPLLVSLMALNFVQAKHFLIETKDIKDEDNKYEDNKYEDNKDEDNKDEDIKAEDNKDEYKKVEDNKVEDNKVKDNKVEDNKDEYNKDEDNKDEDNKDEDNKDEDNKDEDNKDEDNKDEDNKDEDKKDEDNKYKAKKEDLEEEDRLLTEDKKEEDNNYKGFYKATKEELEEEDRLLDLLTEKQVNAVIKSFPNPQKAELIYKSMNKSAQHAIRKILPKVYGNVKEMKEAAKNGSLLDVKIGHGNDYGWLGGGLKLATRWVPKILPELLGQDFGSAGCFSGGSDVQTRRGVISINQLVLGDSVLTISRDKGLIYTEFLGWLDRSANANGEFLKISTNSSSIVLTGNHLIFRYSVADGALESVFADQIEEGNKLVSWKESKIAEESVVAVEPAKERGIWAPLTMEGTLLVDGLLASCYASFPHAVSDLALAPVKMFPRMLLDDEESVKVDGCREVVKLTKKVVTAMGLRQRNQGPWQGDKENAQSGFVSGNEQPALDAASSSKHIEF